MSSIQIQIDEDRECEFIAIMNTHKDVADVNLETKDGHTCITVDAFESEDVLHDVDEFVLCPHTHTAETITTVVFL